MAKLVNGNGNSGSGGEIRKGSPSNSLDSNSGSSSLVTSTTPDMMTSLVPAAAEQQTGAPKDEVRKPAFEGSGGSPGSSFAGVPSYDALKVSQLFIMQVEAGSSDQLRSLKCFCDEAKSRI